MKYVSKHMTVEEARRIGRLGVFQVEECDPSYRGEGVYVIDFRNGIKIGRAKNIKSRIDNAYRMPWVRFVEQIACFKTKNSGGLELLLKRVYRRHMAGSPEFITSVSFDDVVTFIKNNEFFNASSCK